MSRRVMWIVIAAVGLPVMLWWQLTIFRTDLQPTHKIRVSGLHSQDRFAYFLYYKNLFPVATLESGRDWDFYFEDNAPPREPSRLTFSAAAADQIIAQHGSSLVQEWSHTMRWGNFLETYLYLFDAWRLGSPELAETRIANAVVFLLALAGIYVAFWSVGRFGLGIALVLLLGSNPAQLFAAYREENVKSWPITAFCLVAVLLAPVIAGRKLPTWARVVLAMLVGILLATTYQIRSETAATLLGAAAVLMSASFASWKSRIVTAAMLVVAFLGTMGFWHSFFDRKIAESTAVVERAGGHVYPGTFADGHNLWTAVWGGLGDFDTKYGYVSSDSSPLPYVEPLLRERYGIDLPWWWGMSREKQGRGPADYYDADHIYYRAPFEAPHVQELMREKIVHDITHDPLWYGGILLKRVWRILDHNTPVQLLIKDGLAVPMPFHGLVAVAVLLVAWWRRDWTALRCMLLALPLSVIALAINSGGNYTYFGVYHLTAAAIVLTWVGAAIGRTVSARGQRSTIA